MKNYPHIKMDFDRYCHHLEVEGYSIVKKLLYLVFKSPFLVLLLFRLSGSNRRLVSLFAVLFYKIARILSGIQLPRGTKVGGGLLLPHFGNIVINKRSVIGENCTILHNVTLAAKGGGSDSGVPVVGDFVYIGAGAVLLGSIKVGDHATIGAGAVVTKDIPSHHVSYGNPAKSYKKSV